MGEAEGCSHRRGPVKVVSRTRSSQNERMAPSEYPDPLYSEFLSGEASVSWQDNSLVDYAGVYGPKNTLFPCFVEVRSCGPAHNPKSCRWSRIPLPTL